MINFNVYLLNQKNNYINIDNNYFDNNNNDSKNNIKLNIYDWNMLDDKYFLVNLIFPEHQLTNNSNNLESKTNSNNGIWNLLNLRPFKICPCNYNDLLQWSNNSIVNICVFDENNKIIGFCVVSNDSYYYLINILCTNIKQGIGGIIIDFIKNNFNDKPIKLTYTFNSKNFYLKKDFQISKNNINQMIWFNIDR